MPKHQTKEIKSHPRTVVELEPGELVFLFEHHAARDETGNPSE